MEFQVIFLHTGVWGNKAGTVFLLGAQSKAIRSQYRDVSTHVKG